MDPVVSARGKNFRKLNHNGLGRIDVWINIIDILLGNCYGIACCVKINAGGNCEGVLVQHIADYGLRRCDVGGECDHEVAVGWKIILQTEVEEYIGWRTLGVRISHDRLRRFDSID